MLNLLMLGDNQYTIIYARSFGSQMELKASNLYSISVFFAFGTNSLTLILTNLWANYHQHNATRPFQHTGVDLCGPYELRPFTGRNGKFKVWVALFTHMATRAIHLEIVSTLSQFGFLLAFRRFISRRGKTHPHV